MDALFAENGGRAPQRPRLENRGSSAPPTLELIRGIIGAFI